MKNEAKSEDREYTYSDIATILGVSVTRVRQIEKEALAKLAKALKDQDQDQKPKKGDQKNV